MTFPFLGPLRVGMEKGATNPVQRLKERESHINRHLLCSRNQNRNLILFNLLNNPVMKVVVSPFHRWRNRLRDY